MGRPLVLCYHAVSDEWDHLLAVRPRAFERQLTSLLRRGYRPVGASEALAGQGRLLHVTFDDAYRNIAAALEILERLGVPATVFAAREQLTVFQDRGIVIVIVDGQDLKFIAAGANLINVLRGRYEAVRLDTGEAG